MKSEAQLHLLRIFVNESDRCEGRAVYETIVRLAREQGMAGATAFRAIEGFGATGRVHSVKVLHLSEDVPIVVEIIDRPERIAAFLPTLDEIVAEGVVTIEKVYALTYRRDDADADRSDEEIPLESQDATRPEAQPVFSESADPVRKLLEAARESAAESRRVFVDSIDVLLAMLCGPSPIASRSLANLGIDCNTVERSLREEVSRDETSATFAATLVTKSKENAKWLGQSSVEPEHLLLALCQIRPSAATDVLMRLGAQPRDICKEVLTILNRDDDWQAWLADHPDM